DEIAAGARGWVQLYLERAIAADGGDRFVLRVPSPAVTVAGGSFVDVAPRKHPRHDSEVRDSLIRRAEGDVLQEELRKYPRGVTVRALLKATVAPEADVGRLRWRRSPSRKRCGKPAPARSWFVRWPRAARSSV